MSAVLPFKAVHTDTWQNLMDVISRAVALDPNMSLPLVLTSLPELPEYDIDGPPLSFIHGPPGRNIALAVGLRAALPDIPMLLIMNADAVTLGMNHLIHAARRNMGMTLLILRSEVTDAIAKSSVKRTAWRSFGFQDSIERQATPLELATSLEAASVSRGSIEDPNQLAQLINDAMKTRGFSMVGITAAKHLPLGVLSRTNLPEYFESYKGWATSIRTSKKLKTVEKVAKEQESAPQSEPASLGELNPTKLPEYYESYKCWSASVRASMNVEEGAGKITQEPATAIPSRTVPRYEVRVAGIGGQGVKLAGSVLNEAAGKFEGLWTTQRGEYGSATRGGPSLVEVVAGSERIGYPGADHPDVLVLLSKTSVHQFADTIKPNGHLIVDSDQIDSLPAKGIAVPIVKISIEHTGKPIAAGIVSLGCIAAVSDIVSLESLKQSVAQKLPAKLVEKNISALVAGYEATCAILKGENYE